MKSRLGYKGYVIEVRSHELRDGRFSSEFSVEEHEMCDNQDLTVHTMMSDGVATVGQTVFSVAAGANKRCTLALSPGYGS
jgi:hypothetical protein